MSWCAENGAAKTLRSVLYGKWCSVFGDDRELTFKADAVFRKDVYKPESSKYINKFGPHFFPLNNFKMALFLQGIFKKIIGRRSFFKKVFLNGKVESWFFTLILIVLVF